MRRRRRGNSAQPASGPRGGGLQVGRVVLGGAAVLFACFSYSWITLPDVRPLRTSFPATTAFMQMRASEAAHAGRSARVQFRPVPYNRIAPALKRAVLVAEDAGFWDHEGVDWAELRISFETYWKKGGVLRGGSTITQQLAKNLYLSPSRNPYRKLVELAIARRLEAELPKTRIFELYLNLIEWGDGVWGAEAAARTYFNRSAADLSSEQAALLAGAIINPRIYSPAHPRTRLLRRQRIILSRMGGGDTAAPPAASSATDELRSDPMGPDEPEDAGPPVPVETAPADSPH
jgi:monofunctional biosynthetic peptidoglycan transglycosylase